MRVSFAALTDVGCVRRNNEDSFLVADLGSNARFQMPPDSTQGGAETDEGGLLLAVADGMGGALAGEVASGMAIRTLIETVDQLQPDASGEATVESLDQSVQEANRLIYEASLSDKHLRGMGTTLTVALLRERRVCFFQVGDSRGFVARKHKLRQMTKDHSLIGRLIDDKVITAADAERMEGGKNIILQALGAESKVHVDYSETSLGDNDVVLLCTDGLHGCVRLKELDGIVEKNRECEAMARQLVDAARAEGGPDNITVIAAAVESGGETGLPADPLTRAGRALKRWLTRGG